MCLVSSPPAPPPPPPPPPAPPPERIERDPPRIRPRRRPEDESGVQGGATRRLRIPRPGAGPSTSGGGGIQI